MNMSTAITLNLPFSFFAPLIVLTDWVDSEPAEAFTVAPQKPTADPG
jgi:hypothetical protein